MLCDTCVSLRETPAGGADGGRRPPSGALGRARRCVRASPRTVCSAVSRHQHETRDSDSRHYFRVYSVSRHSVQSRRASCAHTSVLAQVWVTHDVCHRPDQRGSHPPCSLFSLPVVNRARRRVLRDATASLRLCALQLARSPGERAHFLGRPCAPLGLVVAGEALAPLG